MQVGTIAFLLVVLRVDPYQPIDAPEKQTSGIRAFLVSVVGKLRNHQFLAPIVMEIVIMRVIFG